MQPPRSNALEVWTKIVAIGGALLSAIALIVTLAQSTSQRRDDLRWGQAKLAAELVDHMLADPQAFAALRMIDWERPELLIDGEKVKIASEQTRAALDPANNDQLPKHGFYIRESFDRLFYHIGKLERSIQSGLITFEDVRSPLKYYAPILCSKYGQVLNGYMPQLHHDDAAKMIRRLRGTPEPPEKEKIEPCAA
jgi:hypothetical protein